MVNQCGISKFRLAKMTLLLIVVLGHGNLSRFKLVSQKCQLCTSYPVNYFCSCSKGKIFLVLRLSHIV